MDNGICLFTYKTYLILPSADFRGVMISQSHVAILGVPRHGGMGPPEGHHHLQRHDQRPVKGKRPGEGRVSEPLSRCLASLHVNHAALHDLPPSLAPLPCSSQQGRQWSLAIDVFNHMVNGGIECDAVTCCSLITALDKGGQWQLAEQVRYRDLDPNV